jgi:hypothetical protein
MPLSRDHWRNGGYSSDIPAWARQADSEALVYCIGGANHDYRDGSSGLLSGLGCRSCVCHNDIYLETNQFGGLGGESIGAIFPVAPFDHKILTLNPSVLAQLVEKVFLGGTQARRGLIKSQVADPNDLSRRLRLGEMNASEK